MLVVMLGFDLTVAVPPPLTVIVVVGKANVLFATALFGCALLSVAVIVPVIVLPRTVTTTPLIVRVTDVPEKLMAVTGHGKPDAAMLVQDVLPENEAAVTASVPLVSENVRLAVHGTGMPFTVNEIGPVMTKVPELTQKLPDRTSHPADAEEVVSEPIANNSASIVVFKSFM